MIKDLCPECIINSKIQPSPLDDTQSNKNVQKYLNRHSPNKIHK